MAKRLTDTDKYKKPFIRGLPGPYKLLWDYLCHECDHAGIWIIDFEVAQVYLGQDMKVNREDALRYFNQGETRIIEIDRNRWFIAPFIEFQYGVLNEQNRVHNSVIKVLKKYNLWDGASKGLTSPLLGSSKGLASPLLGSKDKDKDNNKEKKEGCGEKKEKNKNSQEAENLYEQVIRYFDTDLRPKTKNQKQEWVNTLDKLIHIDGHPPDRIRKVIAWARQDDFWQLNFLSLLKLRKKDKSKVPYFTVFEQRMKINGNNRQSGERYIKRVNDLWNKEE